MKKGMAPKKRIRLRRDSEIVNIDGKEVTWGIFRQKFFDDLDKKEMRGEKIGKRVFILNKGDPNKEKKLFWDPNVGFDSENSDDEAVKYARAERFYKNERNLKNGTEVYL